MTCAEIREEYQNYLDGKNQGEPPAGLRSHLDGCSACTSYLLEIGGIDRALRAMPDVEIPPELLASLKELPGYVGETPEAGVVAYAGRYAALTFGGLLAWILGNLVSPEAQILLEGLTLAAAAFAFTVALLRPLYLRSILTS